MIANNSTTCTPYVHVVQHALRNEKPPVVYDETTPRTHDLSIDCKIRAPTTINKTPDFKYKKEAMRPIMVSLLLSGCLCASLISPTEASSDFSLQEQEGKLRITTTGNGHGMGMSQWTANEMAKEGSSYEEILQFFFAGTELREGEEVRQKI